MWLSNQSVASYAIKWLARPNRTSCSKGGVWYGPIYSDFCMTQNGGGKNGYKFRRAAELINCGKYNGCEFLRELELFIYNSILTITVYSTGVAYRFK